MDVYCFVCEHTWLDHYEKGCYVVINEYEVNRFNVPIKYCACEERVNRAYGEPITETTN